MESSTIHSFSTHAPFKQPVVITHYISMVIAFLGCYPLLLTRKIQRQKVYIASAALFFGLIGFVSGYFIQQIEQNTTSTILHIFSLLLLFLVVIQSILAIYRRLAIRQVKNIPKWIDLALGWIILTIAFSYLTLAALVFTESCNNEQQKSQCLMPVAMGTGFIMYGTLALLHLLAIIKLPRPSTPEYYEGVIITFWGFISLLLAGIVFPPYKRKHSLSFHFIFED
jgi:phosphoglycerol transferase MdoB-like AlkP superfamily enzyme